MERLLVTQALDERDLLAKKINDKIESASFIDVSRNNEERVVNEGVTKEEFEIVARASYQQIMDLIARHQRLDAAIVMSNAMTKIETAVGTLSIAEAISLKNRLQPPAAAFTKGSSFERALVDRMRSQFAEATHYVERYNNKLNENAENMRLSILGKDSKSKDDKPLAVVDAYIKENTGIVVDPLHLKDLIVSLTEERDALLKELETKIKVSNATTYIEF